MNIRQRIPESFTPDRQATKLLVTTFPGNSGLLSSGGIEFEYNIGSNFKYNYRMDGIFTNNAEVSYYSQAIDTSEYPTLKSLSSENYIDLTTIRLKNDRGETSNIQLDFTNKVGLSSVTDAKRVIPGTGSYAEYSWNRVRNLFEAIEAGGLNNHAVFDSNEHRRLTNIIPHSSLTCHSIKNTPPDLAGGHLREYAITPRHVLQIGHSGKGGTTGYTIKFRDVDNNIVNRTVVANVNVLFDSDFSSLTYGNDIRLIVLNQDLPESISPAPIVGDWFYASLSGSKINSTVEFGAFGFASWNRDTHICPIQMTSYTKLNYNIPQTFELSNVTLQGRDFNFQRDVAIGVYITGETVSFPLGGGVREITLDGFKHWSFRDVDGPFYHLVRAGDSGSPWFWPIADDKWAVGCGHSPGVGSALWRPNALNALIEYADQRAGISSGHTVTVAPDPLV